MYALPQDERAFGEIARGGLEGETVFGRFGGRSGGGVAALGAEVANRGTPLGSTSEGVHSGRIVPATWE